MGDDLEVVRHKGGKEWLGLLGGCYLVTMAYGICEWQTENRAACYQP